MSVRAKLEIFLVRTFVKISAKVRERKTSKFFKIFEVLSRQRFCESPISYICFMYSGGRYSPKRETGTHHLHQLICEFMNR